MSLREKHMKMATEVPEDGGPPTINRVSPSKNRSKQKTNSLKQKKKSSGDKRERAHTSGRQLELAPTISAPERTPDFDNEMMMTRRTGQETTASMSNRERTEDDSSTFPGAIAVPGIFGNNSQNSHNQSAGAADTLAIAAFVAEEGDPAHNVGTSDASSSIVYGELVRSKRNKWLIAITFLLVILIGSVIGVVVAVMQQSSNKNEAVNRAPTSNVPTSPPVQDQPTPTVSTNTGPTPTQSTPTNSPPNTLPVMLPTGPASDTFDFQLSLQSYTLTTTGGFDQVASTSSVDSQTQCQTFCAEHDALRYSFNVIGDSCICYSMNSTFSSYCASPWGNQVARTAVASGSILSKHAVASCQTTFCQDFPDDGLCFTENTLSLQDYGLNSAGGFDIATSSDFVTSELECRTFCGSYDAMRYASNVIGDECICYSYNETTTTPCAMPWGDKILSSSIAYGTIFSKLPFMTCSVDFCSAVPNDGLCFTANTLSLQDYSLTTAGGYTVATSSNSVSSELDCGSFCADHDAMRYALSVVGDKCLCYDTTTETSCATPWGESVNTISYVAYGTVFSKQPFNTCSQDFCTVQPDDALCFTANSLDLQDYTLTEAGGYEVAVTGTVVTTEADCRESCAAYDALEWSYSTSGVKCHCFSKIANFTNPWCATPWGDDVNTLSYVASGMLFSKQPFIACNVSFCGADNLDGLCFTGNEQDPSAFAVSNGVLSAAATASTTTTTFACLESCKTFAAAEYNSVTDVCRCFDSLECLTLDSSGRSISGRSLFTKASTIGSCAVSLCELVPDNELCSA